MAPTSVFTVFAPSNSCLRSADVLFETLGIHTSVERTMRAESAPMTAAEAILARGADHHILVVVCKRKTAHAILPCLQATMPEATVDQDERKGMVLIHCAARTTAPK
jgi:hypothetical protein